MDKRPYLVYLVPTPTAITLHFVQLRTPTPQPHPLPPPTLWILVLVSSSYVHANKVNEIHNTVLIFVGIGGFGNVDKLP